MLARGETEYLFRVLESAAHWAALEERTRLDYHIPSCEPPFTRDYAYYKLASLVLDLKSIVDRMSGEV